MKWYEQILEAARSFFSRPEATEAEIHAEFQGTQTLAAMKQNFQQEAKDAVKGELDKLEADNKSLQDKIKALETELETTKSDLKKSNDKVEELEQKASESHTKIDSDGGGSNDESDMPVWEAYKQKIANL